MSKKKKYNFEIEFKPYTRLNGGLNDIRALYIGNICICAKNDKYGEYYQSKYVQNRNGKFAHTAGSVRYPILYPKKTVVLKIEDFPTYPKLEYDKEYYSHIQIKNIEKI